MITKKQIADLFPSGDRYIYKIYVNCVWIDCDKRAYTISDTKKRKKIDRAQRYYSMIKQIAATVVTAAAVTINIDGNNIAIKTAHSLIKLNVAQYPSAVANEIMKIISVQNGFTDNDRVLHVENHK